MSTEAVDSPARELVSQLMILTAVLMPALLWWQFGMLSFQGVIVAYLALISVLLLEISKQ